MALSNLGNWNNINYEVKSDNPNFNRHYWQGTYATLGATVGSTGDDDFVVQHHQQPLSHESSSGDISIKLSNVCIYMS
jgi:hypothetical protein